MREKCGMCEMGREERVVSSGRKFKLLVKDKRGVYGYHVKEVCVGDVMYKRKWY